MEAEQISSVQVGSILVLIAAVAIGGEEGDAVASGGADGGGVGEDVGAGVDVDDGGGKAGRD
jgi:hypothetical protein